ncbi:MAG: response regulator [Nitrospirales bacterium]|nr:response regulator [Nitrospira sp.]MDR4503082.1 response regulator [Nitrospirales bacterium]
MSLLSVIPDREKASRSSQSHDSTQALRVLLIEDDEDDALIAKSLLSSIEGSTFHVDWISSYDEALDVILQNQHDVCLLDYRLEARTGIEFLRETLQYGCQVPIIMMTGAKDQELDFKAIKLGAADYVVKGETASVILNRVILHALERKRADLERQELQTQLLETSRQLGMAEIAINVLHNVGNVLNSINVSSGIIAQSLRQAHVGELGKVAELLNAHHDQLGPYLTDDAKGKLIPQYLQGLGTDLSIRFNRAIQEVDALVSQVDHVKHVIKAQQDIAKPGGLQEPVRAEELIEQALMISHGELVHHHIAIVRDYAHLPQIMLDKHQVLQILVNLIRNAKHAMLAIQNIPHRLTLRLRYCDDLTDHFQIEVQDTGIGIKAENLTRIFAQGFTTKKQGHGIGLHSSALAAKNCGGSLQAISDGERHGATFILRLPLSTIQAPA